MKKIILSLFIFVVIIILTLSLFKKEEREINLGDGYYYIPFQEVIFNVTGFGGNGIYICKKNTKIPVVFSEIKRYKFDSTHIIVRQEFDLKTRYLLENMIFNPNLYFDYDRKRVLLDEKYLHGINKYTNSSERKKYIDKIMQEDKHVKKMIENKENYYIINKKRGKTFGPYRYDEYKNLRLRLRVKIDF